MEEMKISFGAMLRQLPSKTEVANLLADVSQTGMSSGLEFELFKPGSEVPADFYAELPIQIRVIGDYHQFGEFVSKVAALPRIVTLHDFSIQGKDKEEGKLAMDITAKTYRYFDEGENIAAAAGQKRSKK
jgi:type IV pilus assembly protein PilO